jgi:hypothetical protein
LLAGGRIVPQPEDIHQVDYANEQEVIVCIAVGESRIAKALEAWIEIQIVFEGDPVLGV